MFTTGINKLIISNTLAYLITRDEDVAYYYATVLNYLVNAVKRFNGSFILNQYGRPINAIKTANLEWNEEEWQFKVAELSKKTSEKVRQITLQSLNISKVTPLYELIDRGMDAMIKDKLGERAYEILQTLISTTPEVREAFKIINKKVDEKLLKEAIRKVSEGV
jgi:predicted Fe-Mo cluster-binding NifX family protein